MLSTATEFLAFLVAASVASWLWGRRHIYKFAWTYPLAIKGLPPLGAFASIGGLNNLLPFLQSHWHRSVERTAVIWLSLTPFLLTSDPKVVEQLLTRPEFAEKAATIYKPIHDVLQGGMVAMRSEEAGRLRKYFEPAMRHKNLLGLLPIFNSRSEQFIGKLNAIYEAGGKVDNLLDQLHTFTMGMSRRTIMGNLGLVDEQDLPVLKQGIAFMFHQTLLGIVLNCVNLRIMQLNPLFIYTRNKLYKLFSELITYRAKYVSAIHESGGKESTLVAAARPHDVAPPKTDSKLIIDQAFKSYSTGELSWRLLIAESTGLLVASYETSSQTLYSTLLLLAMHPQVQQRVYEEIIAIFPTKDIYVEQEDLQQLKYLEMVLNEALRLFPAVPMIGRETNAVSCLRIHGQDYALPQKMQILIDIYQLHHDERIWGADADQFNPDHFLPQNVAERNAYAFIPFSKGSRNCMGWTYAYFVAKILLVHILRNYQLSTELKFEQVDIKMNIFLEHGSEALLTLQSRA